MRWNCIARANGTPHGSPVISMSSCGWIGSYAPLLANSREGTSWQLILQTLVCYRLPHPPSRAARFRVAAHHIETESGLRLRLTVQLSL
jgi:hypothetical protein